MGQTLTHGVYLPDEGERNCYNGLAANWQLLDGAVGTIAEHTSALAGKAPLVHTHVKSDITDLFNSANTWTSVQTFGNANNPIQMQSTIEEMGVTPAANQSSWLAMMDKNGVQIGFISRDMYASGACSVRINVTDKYDSNGHSSSGANKDCTLALNIDENGNSFLQWSGEILKNSIIPYSTDTHLLGNSTKQWYCVYAKNYYYNGVAWGLDKANTWSAGNTYTSNIALKQTNLEEGELPTSAQTRRFTFTDKNNASLGWSQHRVNTSGDSYLEFYVVNKFSGGQLSTQGSEIANSIVLGLHSDGSRYLTVLGDVYPDLPTRVCNLGTSTNKWKTLNGINPGALSLPDTTRAEPIDTTNWVYTYDPINYIPPEDGWLSVACSNADYIQLEVLAHWGLSISKGADGYCTGIIPVKKGTTSKIRIKATTGQTVVVRRASFYPGTGDPSFTVTPLNNS